MLKCEPVDLPVGRWFGAGGGVDLAAGLYYYYYYRAAF